MWFWLLVLLIVVVLISRAQQQCSADFTLNKQQCNQRIKQCNKSNVPLKWSAKKACKQLLGKKEGGCLCAQDCNFACKAGCVANSQYCFWNATATTQKGQCFNKQTLLSTARANTSTCETIKPFKIKLVFESVQPTAAVKDAFNRAAKKWSLVISRSFNKPITIPAGSYCNERYVMEHATKVQDLQIIIVVEPIDGVSNTLGSAGICVVDNSNLPRLGRMRFDSADLDELHKRGDLFRVILHEMGHVMGIGVLWIGQTPAVFNDTLASKPEGGYKYLLPQANLGDYEVGRRGQALVEDSGGSGTAFGHWKDVVYENELMTGYFSKTNGKAPLSILTLRSLIDIGYPHVDLSQAEPYRVPSSPHIDEEKLVVSYSDDRIAIHNDIDLYPIFRLP